MTRLFALIAAALLAIAAPAHAQSDAWPSKPVKFIVPLPAGSAVDTVARLVGDRLGALWGKAVVIDNRAGAGGIPAMSSLARSPADGYTFGLVVATVVTLTPHLYKDPQFNLDTDMTAVATIGTAPMLMAVNPGTGANNLAEFVALARKQPGKLNFAIPMQNSVPHLAGEMLSAAAGMKLFPVAYRGSTPAVTSALSGESQVIVDALPALIEHVKVGKLKALAVTSKNRLPGYEQIPTLHESYPGMQAIGWFNLLAPANTPQAVIDKVNRDVNTVLRQPDLVARLGEMGVYPAPGSVKDAQDFMRTERQTWAKVIKDLGVEPLN